VLTVARRVVWRHAQNARVSGDVIVWRVDYTSIKVPERRGRGSVEAYPGAMQEEGVRVESREERKRGAQARELQYCRETSYQVLYCTVQYIQYSTVLYPGTRVQ
jgi:hypothetical protein